MWYIKFSQFVDLSALLLEACKIIIVKQMKKPKPCITLTDKTLQTFENTREMYKTLWSFFISFLGVLKCLS